MHVEEDQIRRVLLDQVDGFDAILALRHHLHVIQRLQQIRQLVAGQLLVVNNEGGERHGFAFLF